MPLNHISVKSFDTCECVFHIGFDDQTSPAIDVYLSPEEAINLHNQLISSQLRRLEDARPDVGSVINEAKRIITRAAEWQEIVDFSWADDYFRLMAWRQVMQEEYNFGYIVIASNTAKTNEQKKIDIKQLEDRTIRLFSINPSPQPLANICKIHESLGHTEKRWNTVLEEVQRKNISLEIASHILPVLKRKDNLYSIAWGFDQDRVLILAPLIPVTTNQQKNIQQAIELQLGQNIVRMTDGK